MRGFPIYTASALAALSLASCNFVSAQLEDALATLSSALDDLAWNMAPLEILKSLTIGDLATPDDIKNGTIALNNLNPATTSIAEKFLRPHGLAQDTYLVTVARQSGTDCGFHAIANSFLLSSALMAQSRHEAYSWLAKMLEERSAETIKEKMGNICAMGDWGADDALNLHEEPESLSSPIIEADVRAASYPLMSETVYRAIKADNTEGIDKSFSVVLGLNSANFKNDPSHPFVLGHPSKDIFAARAQNFVKNRTPLILPMVVLASEALRQTPVNAHNVSFIAVQNGKKPAFLLADSLGLGTGYGLTKFLPMLIDMFK